MPSKIPTGYKELRVIIPASWHGEIVDASKAQGLSISSLVRVILRTFLRERYDEQSRRILQ